MHRTQQVLQDVPADLPVPGAPPPCVRSVVDVVEDSLLGGVTYAACNIDGG
jgi:hypothetical protein